MINGETDGFRGKYLVSTERFNYTYFLTTFMAKGITNLFFHFARFRQSRHFLQDIQQLYQKLLVLLHQLVCRTFIFSRQSVIKQELLRYLFPSPKVCAAEILVHCTCCW